MTHTHLVAMTLAGLICGGTQRLMAEDTVKLEYKLASGTELVYKTEGTFAMSRTGQHTAMNATLSAETRMVVCDTDAARHLAMIAKLRSANADMVANTPQGDQKRSEVRADADLLQIDLTGRPVPRQWKFEDTGTDQERLRALRFLISRFDQNALDAVTLAPGNVTIGTQWESQFGFPTSTDMPVPTKASSTLVAVRNVNGKKCAIIKSTLLPSETTENPGGMVFTGDVETLFDIERGLTREIRMDIHLRSKTVDAGTFDFKTQLASERMMSQEEVMRYAVLAKDLGAALAKLCENDADGAVAALQALQMRDMAEDWKKGIDGTLQSATRLQTVFRAQAGASPRQWRRERKAVRPHVRERKGTSGTSSGPVAQILLGTPIAFLIGAS